MRGEDKPRLWRFGDAVVVPFVRLGEEDRKCESCELILVRPEPLSMQLQLHLKFLF